jgi:hypothetical protein
MDREDDPEGLQAPEDLGDINDDDKADETVAPE